jgi:hypothetical protein
VGKKSGKKSAAAGDFEKPLPPLNPVATDVGTNRLFNNGAATVSFTVDPLSTVPTSFTVRSTPGSFTGEGSASPITVVGLQSNVNYTFKVLATNVNGNSDESVSSNQILATTVPGIPRTPAVSSTVADQD